MKIPALPTDEVTITVPRSLRKLDESAYTSLALDSWPEVSAFIDLLQEDLGLTSTYIGANWVASGYTAVRTPERFWVMKDKLDGLELSNCEQAAVESLAEAGHRFRTTDVRVAHRMRSGWTPCEEMRRVACGQDSQLFRGHVTREHGALALPFGKTRLSGRPTGPYWAIWVAVEIG